MREIDLPNDIPLMHENSYSSKTRMHPVSNLRAVIIIRMHSHCIRLATTIALNSFGAHANDGLKDIIYRTNINVRGIE